jgi:hypothetical protein
MIFFMIHFSLMLGGLIMLIVAWSQYRKSMKLIRVGEKAKARVVDIVEETVDTDVYYKPVFEFTTLSNDTRQYIPGTRSDKFEWSIGEETTVIYNPFHPEQVKRVGFQYLFVWSVILLSIALPSLLIGSGYFIFLYIF